MAEIADLLRPDVDRILASASFIGGPDVAEFERRYAEFVGVGHCVGVANGTDGIELALRAVGAGRGDEVILPANTFIATAEAVIRAGATPVLVDVDDKSLLIDPVQVEEALTPRTKAVLPVHLYGQIAPMELLADALDGTDVVVIEDAAQSQGATRWGQASGSIGRLASTSFYPGKNLGAAGDAGAVTTNDSDLSDAVRLLGAHGSSRKYVHDTLGFNSRLDTLQAAILNHKLRRLPDWNAARRLAGERYLELLGYDSKIGVPSVLEGNEHVWHLFVVRVPHRDVVVQRLGELGVGAAVHYPTPIHLTGAFASLGHRPGDFPVSERAADEILSLPMFPHITASQQERVVEALQRVLA
jgi:dTDP-4-amino-4,6-dideoxygalactose transaminase